MAMREEEGAGNNAMARDSGSIAGASADSIARASFPAVAPRIANLPEWRDHLLFRLRRQFAETADPVLSDLLTELTAYPHGGSRRAQDLSAIAVPLQFRSERGVLSLLSTTMMFGTPLDPTLSELALETFLPADTATAEALRAMMAK